MGRYETLTWSSDIAGLGIPRRDRARGRYLAFIPDRLANRSFTLAGDTAADVADAERAMTRLDHRAASLTNTEVLARLLLRAESVASSRIEGLVASPQRLLRAALTKDEDTAPTDQLAAEVLANIDAMAYAIEGTGPITIDRICEVHRRLMVATKNAAAAGVLRTEQNWIGGSDYNPIGADFVPPPYEAIDELLVDLCEFCNGDGLPAVAQAAIAHAQFETIHPFVDGNGRTGRALIYMVLRRRGLAVRATPPISLVLATRSKDYIGRLDATRTTEAPTSAVAIDAFNSWIAFFAACCVRAVADAETFEQRIATIQAGWLTRLGSLRADASARRLIDVLPAIPVVTVTGAARAIGRQFAAANEAIADLVSLDILSPVTPGKRNRAFEAREIIEAFTALERQLASPSGDTKSVAKTSASQRSVDHHIK